MSVTEWKRRPAAFSVFVAQWLGVVLGKKGIILSNFQAEPNSLVWQVSGFVAHSLQPLQGCASLAPRQPPAIRRALVSS